MKLEQRKISDYEFGLGEALNTIKMIAFGETNSGRDNPDNVFTYDMNGLFIDTCFTNDTGYWETGIEDHRYYERMIIVCEYNNREEAKKGHDNWVKILTGKKLPKEIKDVHIDEIYKLIKKEA